MKLRPLTLLTSLSFLFSAAAFAQKPGDLVTPAALGKAEWIQGTAPAAWEPGKLYIIECWATWCGPCIGAIPHMDALYDKYYGKGLRVVGMNVWEDGKDKVADFVKKKGDGMSYPVAYTGKDGAFDTGWLKVAGVKGIPYTFLVKDGKVLQSCYPWYITDVLVENLLAGGDAEKKVVDDITQAVEKGEESEKLFMVILEAAEKKDVPAQEKAIAALKAFDPGNGRLPEQEFDLLLNKKDWASVSSLLEKTTDDDTKGSYAQMAINSGSESGDSPESLRRELAATLTRLLEKKGGFFEFINLARVQWSLDDKDAAKATVKRAVEWTNTIPPEYNRDNYLTNVFVKFAAHLDAGEFPTRMQINAWTTE